MNANSSRKGFFSTMFGNVGLLTLSFQSLYYLSIAGYVAFIGACSYCLAKPSLTTSLNLSKTNEVLMAWLLVTNAVALISGVMFLKF